MHIQNWASIFGSIIFSIVSMQNWIVLVVHFWIGSTYTSKIGFDCSWSSISGRLFLNVRLIQNLIIMAIHFWKAVYNKWWGQFIILVR